MGGGAKNGIAHCFSERSLITIEVTSRNNCPLPALQQSNFLYLPAVR